MVIPIEARVIIKLKLVEKKQVPNAIYGNTGRIADEENKG